MIEVQSYKIKKSKTKMGQSIWIVLFTALLLARICNLTLVECMREQMSELREIS